MNARHYLIRVFSGGIENWFKETPVDPAQADAALRKAYTALSYGVATHELKPFSKPMWLSPEVIDAGRVAFF